MLKLKILGLNNNFFGSYESNQVFYKELMTAFEKNGNDVYRASTVSEAKMVYDNVNLDFTICFSKYFYEYDGKFLYDLYEVPNYQWVSDNPLKMTLDVKSKFIHYIFIDLEYPNILSKLINKPLFLPLGFLENNIRCFSKEQKGILFPCKIRNFESIIRKINACTLRKQIWDFIDFYKLDDSYINALNCFFELYGIYSARDKEMLFRLSNEYLRIKKRCIVLDAINNKEVFVVGENFNNHFNNMSHIHFLPTVGYKDIGSIMQKYRYIINVDPNYDACIHDRFVKAVASGTICVTNYNEVMDLFNPYTFKFSDVEKINDLIATIDGQIDVVSNFQSQMISDFSWESSSRKIADNYLYKKDINAYEISNKI